MKSPAYPDEDRNRVPLDNEIDPQKAIETTIDLDPLS